MAKLCRSWSLMCTCLVLACAAAGPCGVAATADDPAARMAELRATIAYHDELYFKNAAPEISDAAYDRLKQELSTLERDHPELAGEAPAGSCSDDRTGRFPTARHLVPMLSLEKAYDTDALRAFHARLGRDLGCDDVVCVVEPKIDGVAISLVYEHGRLVRAVTRGNGMEGDDITANVRTIDALPHALAGDGPGPAAVPERIELRGELYLSFEAFARINRDREAAGETPFANPRNAAAGTARLSDPAAVAGRGLAVILYGIGACEPASLRPATQQDLIARIRDWRLPTFERVSVARGADELVRTVIGFGEARGTLPFPTDGAVVKVDDAAGCARLGDGPEAPRWAIAYKYVPLRVNTRVRGITIQVGRSGVLTPVAELDPVTVSGSTVTRATLHNREALARIDVRVGDTVLIEKAGEIVPAIVGVDRSQRPADSMPFVFPGTCPACSSSIRSDDGATARCPEERCPGQVRRRLEHFASMSAVNIEGLGPAMIDLLVARGLVDQPSDLFHLRRDQLLSLGDEVDITADALLTAIEQSRSSELWRVVYGLSIPRVGAMTARKLATVYPDLNALAGLVREDFDASGRAAALALGETTERAIVNWIAEPHHRALLRDLAASGVGSRAADPRPGKVAAITGKVFVLTGTLERFSRDEATGRIIAAGGRVAASVSRRTDYVVAGAEPGEKLARARELGILVIDEAELLHLLESP